jgi:hypothetical protein
VLGVSLDTALWELRKQLAVPVTGMMEAGLLVASTVGSRYEVLTFGARMILLYEELVSIGISNAIVPQSRRECTLWVVEATSPLPNPAQGAWQCALPAASRPQGCRYRACLARGSSLQCSSIIIICNQKPCYMASGCSAHPTGMLDSAELHKSSLDNARRSPTVYIPS